MGSKQKPAIKPSGAALSTGAADFAQQYYWLLAGVLLAAIAFICFYNLGALPARDWDEARHGVSAYEMMKTNQFIVNTYQYQPDYWNLKPPLSFWGVMLGYRLFGYSLLGLRFYSALSFVLTAAIIGLFAKWRYGALESLLILLLMACSSPFYRNHFARHGDADALFTLFTVVSLLALLLMEERPWALYACSGAFSLAFLTKSWHALFIVAVVGVVMLWRGTMRRMNWKQWAGFFAAGAAPILLWMLARYSYDGTLFFTEMVRVDLLNRTTQVIENHSGGFGAYFTWLFRLTMVTGVLPVAVLLMYLAYFFDAKRCLPNKPAVTRDIPALLIWFALPLILFSIVRTKLSWYLIPIIIPLEICTGLWLAQVLQGPKKDKLNRAAACVIAAALLVPSAVQVWRDIQPPYEDGLQLFLHGQRGDAAALTGKKAYLALDVYEVPEQGLQKYVLLGELYFDWDCVTAGVEAFLADSSAEILLVTEEDYGAYQEALAACRVVAQGGGFLIVEK